MYFVEDGTSAAGFYECGECFNRFLDARIAPRLMCPYCGQEADMEIGPDDEMPQDNMTAQLLEVVEGDDVEKYDTLLSHTILDDTDDWL